MRGEAYVKLFAWGMQKVLEFHRDKKPLTKIDVDEAWELYEKERDEFEEVCWDLLQLNRKDDASGAAPSIKRTVLLRRLHEEGYDLANSVLILLIASGSLDVIYPGVRENPDGHLGSR